MAITRFIGTEVLSMRKQHWAQINEVTFITGIKFLFWIYKLFGRTPFKIMLYPVVGYYVITHPSARDASNDYLSHIDKNYKSSVLKNLKHFMSFAESILDKLLLWGNLFKLDNIQYFGQKKILDNLNEKRGGLIICSHLGNLELCRVLSQHCKGLNITVLMHTKHAKAFNQLLAKLNPSSRLNIIQVTEMSVVTAIELTDKIKQGEFVVIAGDRIPVSPDPRVASVPFLGQNALFPVGPYILAHLLQCPVYLLFSIRTQHGAELYFELFRESIKLPRKNRDEILRQLAADYAARLAYYCHKAPLQWYNFYNFWNTHANHSI